MSAGGGIATVVSTGVLRPQTAVLFAAAFNVIAIFVFHLNVAATVGKGIVDAGVVDHHVVFGALIGAIVWTLITWWYGIPSSSSHALIGGIVGASVAPFFAQQLVEMGGLSWVGGYVSAAALLSLIAVLCLKETRHADLDAIA